MSYTLMALAHPNDRAVLTAPIGQRQYRSSSINHYDQHHCTSTPERNRIRCIHHREVTMPTMTMRLDETDAEVVRKYAEFEGKTISDFVRDAVFEKIEDQQDLATLREAVAADNGVRYTHEQVLAQLGL